MRRRKKYNGLIGAHHYWGYTQSTGEQLQYVLMLTERPRAVIGFNAAAWRR